MPGFPTDGTMLAFGRSGQGARSTPQSALSKDAGSRCFQRLTEGPRGFGALHRALPGMSRKVLAEQLRQMESDDLLLRREIGDRLGSVQYS